MRSGDCPRVCLAVEAFIPNPQEQSSAFYQIRAASTSRIRKWFIRASSRCLRSAVAQHDGPCRTGTGLVARLNASQLYSANQSQMPLWLAFDHELETCNRDGVDGPKTLRVWVGGIQLTLENASTISTSIGAQARRVATTYLAWSLRDQPQSLIIYPGQEKIRFVPLCVTSWDRLFWDRVQQELLRMGFPFLEVDSRPTFSVKLSHSLTAYSPSTQTFDDQSDWIFPYNTS